MADNVIIKQHDDDVIFSLESLKEFIRLIQRQGINNLVIYSVKDDLLKDDAYTNILVKDGSNNTEFNRDELTKAGRTSCFVLVRYTWPWSNPDIEHNSDINVISGRHQFIKSGNTTKFSPILRSFTNNTDVIITTGTQAEEAKVGQTGTFCALIDDNQQTIKINGFNDEGEYTGNFKPSSTSANNGTFLRGDGEWSNILVNHFLPGAHNTYNLGATNTAWANIFVTNMHGTADQAIADESGNNIKASYGASITYNNSILSLKNKNGTVISTATISVTDDKTSSSNSTSKLYLVGATLQSTTGVSTYSNKNVYTQSGYLYATRVYNAVFNDYAECRKTINLEAGRVVIDNDDGSLSCSTQRLLPFNG